MIAHQPTPTANRRRGFGLLEMAMTGGLILVAMAATVQVVGWIALERKAVERRERALLEAENLLERIVAVPWDDLTTESVARFRVSDAASDQLHGPTLKVQVLPSGSPPAQKRVVVEIRWADRSGQSEAPVRLVTWVTKRGTSR